MLNKWLPYTRRAPKPVPFVPSDAGRISDGYSHEKEDCAVRAIATACEMPYHRAHSLLQQRLGRVDGHAVYDFPNWLNNMMDTEHNVNGYRVTETQDFRSDFSKPTVRAVRREHSEGRYIFRVVYKKRGEVYGHVFAVINGEIWDECLIPPSYKISQYWRFEKV